MTDPLASSEGDASEEDVAGLLNRPLSDDEYTLLEAIWKLAFAPQFIPTGSTGAWQTWDYIWRMAARGRPDFLNPEDLLDGLPSVPVPNTAGRSYGLVFRMTAASDSPRSDSLGLTLAGIYRLGERIPELRSYADVLTRLVSAIARASRDLEPRRGGAVQERRPLESFGPYVEALSRLDRPAHTDLIPISAIGQLLPREYAPVVVNLDNDVWIVDLGWTRASEFASIENAAAYVRKIGLGARRASVPAEVASPLTLIQTLDYLSYVIGAHPSWPKHLRFVSAPDLQSAAVIGQPVTTQTDFERAVAAVWNVISQLQLPATSDKSAGSITKLQSWLEQNVESPLPREVIDALGQIRAVGRVRAGIAHNSPSTRASANDAKIRLGIPVVTVDWAAAWRITQAQLSVAFDTVRQAIQDAEFAAGQ